MKQSVGTAKITRIIACSVFRTAMKALQLEQLHPNLRISYLPSTLHLRPYELKKKVLARIDAAKGRSERVICLLGECFPDAESICRERGVLKAPGQYCYEMLLGNEEFKKMLDETAGTYFIEKELIQNFQEYCVIPLELDDEEMKSACFEHYKKLMYLRQSSDPDLEAEAGDVADFLGLSIDIHDVDYSHIEKSIKALL